MAIINLHMLYSAVPNFIKQPLLDIKGKIDSNTLIVCDFNTLLSSIDASSRQKIEKLQIKLHY
jgi:hypothetical protein